MPEVGARLDLEAVDAALAAVPEEEEIGLRRVALDEVVDPVVVVEDAELRARHRVARREVELQAGLGLEVGVAGDEAAARRAAEVAVRERRVAEAARDLRGDAQA